MIRPFRIPLILFTPKSLLRHPRCVSTLEDLSHGRFLEVIDDTKAEATNILKVLFCSGKIYYELLDKQEKDKRSDVAIIRMEQLNPFPLEQLNNIVKKYSKATHWILVQEEPEQMGAWTFMLRKFKGIPLQYIGRKEAASPSTGYHKQFLKEQNDIIERAYQ